MRIDENGIHDVPMFDLVPIVRCKDCKWFDDYEVECSLSIGLVYATSYDYCSRGVRKETKDANKTD